ncbi:MAG TPA: translation elongation factor 4, partial [Candidatus Paceibacterota bacterium]|nr:translation elongation factor 4 [Candidatus Paceibacterota bacterium]
MSETNNNFSTSGNIVRNFAIIAHVDHGKSTLADRLLEYTDTIKKDKLKSQYLDQMSLERERGITIKLQPVRMEFERKGRHCIFNLIDTPGHVDFTYEVSRSLAAVEGAVLLVDATQGIQAQTIGNLNLAQKQGLKIIGAINKIDLPGADIDNRRLELAALLNVDPEEILLVSAKTGQGVQVLMDRIITDFPQPTGDKNKPFKALVFDSVYDSFRGVIAYVRVVDGKINGRAKLHFIAKERSVQSIESGYFKPELLPQEFLEANDIGFIATGLKDSSVVTIGDTITDATGLANGVTLLPGYKEPQPVVFAGFYPIDQKQFEEFREAILRLKLNDSSLFYEPDNSEALGRGFRLGFLGLLHLEITQERLTTEYNLQLVTTSPNVNYKIYLHDQREIYISNPAEWPDDQFIEHVEEPMVRVEILVPTGFFPPVLNLFNCIRSSTLVSSKTVGNETVILHYELPLSELIKDLYDKLKSASQGFASLSYEIIDYRAAAVTLLKVRLAGKLFPSLCRVAPLSNIERESRQLATNLKEILPRE